MPEGLPPYVLVARIGSVLGMGLSLAAALLFLIGGLVGPALVAFLAFVPSLAVILLVERHTAAGGR